MTTKIEVWRRIETPPQRWRTEPRLWIKARHPREGKRPNVSDESQFHQPPQVPSCIAHQLPNDIANILTTTIKPGVKALNRKVTGGWKEPDSYNGVRLINVKVRKVETEK